jgi:hypothetical protein
VKQYGEKIRWKNVVYTKDDPGYDSIYRQYNPYYGQGLEPPTETTVAAQGGVPSLAEILGGAAPDLQSRVPAVTPRVPSPTPSPYVTGLQQAMAQDVEERRRRMMQQIPSVQPRSYGGFGR